MGEQLLRDDHLSKLKHGGTEGTETHGGPWRGPNRYRDSGRWLGLLVNFNTDLVERGLRRVLDG